MKHEAITIAFSPGVDILIFLVIVALWHGLVYFGKGK